MDRHYTQKGPINFFYFHILYKVLEAGLTKLDTGYDLQQAKKGVKFME